MMEARHDSQTPTQVHPWVQALSPLDVRAKDATRATTQAIKLTVLHVYDLRGGGIETQNRSDRQGLGLSRRNKLRFAAQELLALLAQLAHNQVIWHATILRKRIGVFGSMAFSAQCAMCCRLPMVSRSASMGRFSWLQPMRSIRLVVAFHKTLISDDL